MDNQAKFVTNIALWRNPGGRVRYDTLRVGFDVDGHVFGTQFHIRNCQGGDPASNQGGAIGRAFVQPLEASLQSLRLAGVHHIGKRPAMLGMEKLVGAAGDAVLQSCPNGRGVTDVDFHIWVGCCAFIWELRKRVANREERY